MIVAPVIGIGERGQDAVVKRWINARRLRRQYGQASWSSQKAPVGTSSQEQTASQGAGLVEAIRRRLILFKTGIMLNGERWNAQRWNGKMLSDSPVQLCFNSPSYHSELFEQCLQYTYFWGKPKSGEKRRIWMYKHTIGVVAALQWPGRSENTGDTDERRALWQRDSIARQDDDRHQSHWWGCQHSQTEYGDDGKPTT